MTVRLWAQSLVDMELHPLEVFQFPGGEFHIDVEGSNLDEDVAHRWIAEVKGADANDLVVANLMANIAKERMEARYLLIPYLPAARADRGTPFGLGVYARIINAGDWNGVLTVDVHNPLAARREVVGLQDLDVSSLVAEASWDKGFTAVIAPDKGATDRAFAVADKLGVGTIVANKKREFSTGKILEITCPKLDPSGNYLVVDDICDGGGTFNGLAAATGLDPDQLSLWVTHGIFSGASSSLWDHYKEIHTTDSHPGTLQLGKWTTKAPLWPWMMRSIDNR
ncbi:phosphoribosyl pyrophosphate transferase [Gordonia phage BrutonGaster]|uniref:ribose-phosphate diphosphokinase n=1 Tax=Gordonia phage BrutonGaster TaxID=2530116 RepID=A0A482JH80_9CAUD|nr:ribose-phosphate pyrophosphokinase [Gordonia phage BrutonGaster]QBP33308.1 phosphoribosyl pyrophosphate transferase [Gordonia phage BrutonGaster]